jgi:hypothetical protein
MTPARQDCQAMYIGQGSHIVCTIAFGEDVGRVPRDVVNMEVNCLKMKQRHGQHGTLYWDENTTVVKHLDRIDSNAKYEFPYETNEVSNEFATDAHVQNARIGEIISLVLYVLDAEQSQTQNTAEPFMRVHGLDMDGVSCGPLRFWRTTSEEIEQGLYYIFRGMKVIAETQWCNQANKYIPREDNRKTIEVTFRTAAEDVSHISSITSIFAN